MPKNVYDWEKIQAEYRAGALSIREIAARNNCSEAAIRKRAKHHGWERNLLDKVMIKTRAKLMECPDVPEEIAVEQAATEAADIIRLHRASVRKLAEAEYRLMEEMDADASMTIGQKAYVLNAIASTQAKRIPLERQAYSMDAKEDKSTAAGALTDAELDIELGRLQDDA